MYKNSQDSKITQGVIAIICCLGLALIWHLIPQLGIALIALLPALLVLSLKLPFALCLTFICF